MKPDTRVTFPLAADPGVLSKDFVAGTVKRSGDILIGMIDPAVAELTSASPTGGARINEVAAIVHLRMIVEFDMGKGGADNRFRMHDVVSGLPGEHAATG